MNRSINTSRPARSQSLYRRYFEKGVRKLRAAFLRSRAYQLIGELYQSGLRCKICLIVDELKILHITRLWSIAKQYFHEMRRRAPCVSHVISNLSHTLDEILAQLRPATA